MDNKYPEYSASTTYSSGDRFSFKGQAFDVSVGSVINCSPDDPRSKNLYEPVIGDSFSIYGFLKEFKLRADYQSRPVSDIIENL